MSDSPYEKPTPKLETVVCVASHPVDLADGRSLEPGEVADGIDVNDPHNAQLVESDAILVRQAKAPAPSTAAPTTTSPDSAGTDAPGAAPKAGA